jgi:hypothetical protein
LGRFAGLDYLRVGHRRLGVLDHQGHGGRHLAGIDRVGGGEGGVDDVPAGISAAHVDAAGDLEAPPGLVRAFADLGHAAGDDIAEAGVGGTDSQNGEEEEELHRRGLVS